MAQAQNIRPVGDEHGGGLFVLGWCPWLNKPVRHGGNAGLDAIGNEIAENGVWRQGGVRPDFLGQLAGIGRQRFEALGQPGVFRLLDLDFLLHQGGPFGGGVRLHLGQLELVGQLLFLGLGKLVASA